ncbi:transposase [Streptomyces sp. NPDC004589]|uniref:transposase n=1 Tax=Streptomyces sp. NPDC004589 TaxID=3154553 RepID=UPI0033B89611
MGITDGFGGQLSGGDLEVLREEVVAGCQVCHSAVGVVKDDQVPTPAGLAVGVGFADFAEHFHSAQLGNILKAVFTRRTRQEFTGRINRAVMHGHLWSPSYFCASCGGAPLLIVRQYIEQQERPL